jgi:hypothetical protein
MFRTLQAAYLDLADLDDADDLAAHLRADDLVVCGSDELVIEAAVVEPAAEPAVGGTDAMGTPTVEPESSVQLRCRFRPDSGRKMVGRTLPGQRFGSSLAG